MVSELVKTTCIISIYFSTFRNHVEFVFDDPLSTQKDKKKNARWFGTRIGPQGHGFSKTLP